jgi:glutaminase
MSITSSCISTGHLPPAQRVQALVADAHARFKAIDDGKVADYIPALAAVPRDLFAVCVVESGGTTHEAGDSAHLFSMQSVSKPFLFALVCEALGDEVARAKLGVNSTGLPFNSLLAVEREDGSTNPMVNAGAIAAASLAPGDTAEAKWRFIHEGLSRFAGRELELDREVYASEAASNQHNQRTARLLQRYGRIYFDPAEATDVYTRQCALKVTARDLALMSATLANGGVHPLTRERIIDGVHCQRVLAVMVTAGLYENSGEWLYDTGLPGKSGVSGGIVAVAPGKAGLCTFAPPLDAAGNSVRGQLAARYLAERLGLNLFASEASAASPP